VNAVGYVNITVAPGYSLIANPLNSTNNTVGSLLNVPDGTTVYKYNENTAQYVPNSYFFGWTDPNMTMNPGEGLFFNNAGSTNIVLTFVGEVMQGNVTNAVPAGYSVRSSKIPQSGRLDTVLEFPIADGDTVYFFDNATGQYVPYSYLFGSWSQDPIVAVGQSFFVNKSAPATWARTFSVNN
jgi:hypothetical protein